LAGTYARCKLMGHSMVSCAKTVEPINSMFWTDSGGPKEQCVRWGCGSPNEKGQYSAVVWAIQIRCRCHSTIAAAFAAKRDHSVCHTHTHTHTHTSVLRPVFRDHLGEPVPGENFGTLWCKRRLTEADTPTTRLGATPSGLSSAHLHHPPRQAQLEI